MVLDDFFYFMYNYRTTVLAVDRLSDTYQIGLPDIHNTTDSETTTCAGGRDMAQQASRAPSEVGIP